MPSKTSRLAQSTLACGLAALLATPALAAERSPAGIRATLVGQGVESWAFPLDEGPVLVSVDRQLLALPLIEVLISVASAGEVLIGLTFHRTHRGDDSEFGSASGSAYAFGATVGYAHALLADDTTALRIGGRIGTGTGGTSSTFEDGDFSETVDEDYDGLLINLSLFTSGEVMFGRYFGLQGELGLNYLSASFGTDQEASVGWLGLYTGLSAVVRF